MPIIISSEETPSPGLVTGRSNVSVQVPHMQWPFRMGGVNSSGIAFVEQDSPEEIEQCVALVLVTRPGDFPDEPTLGLIEPAFRQGGVSQADIEAAVHRWEPRAQINFTSDELVAVTQTLGIEVVT